MNKILKLNPQLFADEGATGFAAGSAEATGSANEGQVAADTGTENGSQVDTRAEDFQALINGEYKAEYQALLESALNKRLKTSNQKLKKSEEYKQEIQPLLELLGTKYALDTTDVGAIIAAAQEDDSYFEQYAVAHNCDIPTAKTLAKAERITAADEARKRDEKLNEEFNLKYAGWLQEADELKEYYPNFDFEYESRNEETGNAFRGMLNAGISVRNAYEVIHLKELMGGAMHYSYQSAKQDAADARTARRSRPNENGTTSQQASTIIDDITKLSPIQRKKIKDAVNRGERVSAENFRKFL